MDIYFSWALSTNFQEFPVLVKTTLNPQHTHFQTTSKVEMAHVEYHYDYLILQ